MLKRAAQRAAPATEHINRALSDGCGAFRGVHVDDFHGADINAEVAHLLEEAVVCGCSERHSYFLACQFCGVCLVDFERFGNDAVVIVGIADGYVEDLEILPA